VFFIGGSYRNRKDGPTNGRAKKCPVDTFLVRGRFHGFPDATRRVVDEKPSCPVHRNQFRPVPLLGLSVRESNLLNATPRLTVARRVGPRRLLIDNRFPYGSLLLTVEERHNHPTNSPATLQSVHSAPLPFWPFSQTLRQIHHLLIGPGIP